jgi:Tol biopolymer transport system component
MLSVAVSALLLLTGWWTGQVKSSVAVGSESGGPFAASPSVAFAQWTATTGQLSLVVEEPTGFHLRQGLKRSSSQNALPVPFDGPTFYPDGSALAYAGFTRNEGHAIFAVAVNGGQLLQIPGTDGGSHPVLSPDGLTLAFARSRQKLSLAGLPHVVTKTSIWLVNLMTHQKDRVTPWEVNTELTPTSFSPDGARLSLTKGSSRREQVLVLDLRNDSLKLIAKNASEGAFSPDGNQIAFAKRVDSRAKAGSGSRRVQIAIYGAESDGSSARKLVGSGGGQALSPAWDSFGERLAYISVAAAGHRRRPAQVSLMEVNADGTCPTMIYSASSSTSSLGGGIPIAGPVWQPSSLPAGRIGCG